MLKERTFQTKEYHYSMYVCDNANNPSTSYASETKLAILQISSAISIEKKLEFVPLSRQDFIP